MTTRVNLVSPAKLVLTFKDLPEGDFFTIDEPTNKFIGLKLHKSHVQKDMNTVVIQSAAGTDKVRGTLATILDNRNVIAIEAAEFYANR